MPSSEEVVFKRIFSVSLHITETLQKSSSAVHRNFKMVLFGFKRNKKFHYLHQLLSKASDICTPLKVWNRGKMNNISNVFFLQHRIKLVR